MGGSSRLDRGVGCLVGAAVGDALGAGYEFTRSPSDPICMKGGGSFGWEQGEWTDDTQMTICLAQSVREGHVDLELVGERFLGWAGSGVKDIGIQTRAVLGDASGPSDLSRAAADYFNKHPGNSAGNGSLMRTAPVALVHLGDDELIWKTARDVSALTHGDPRAGEACGLWCIAIDRAIREDRLDGIHDGLELLEPARRSFWADAIEAAEGNDPRTFTPNGYVVTALQAAHAAVIQTPIPEAFPSTHFSDALRRAVRIGHDTDTVASIAGALLGARWGASGMPCLATSLIHGWPEMVRRDLGVLAVRCMGRDNDESGWPDAASLSEHYRTAPEAEGKWGHLSTQPRLIIGDVGALGLLGDEFDADVVVSLCRLGHDDVPEGIAHHEIRMIDESAPSSNENLDWLLVDLAFSIEAWIDDGNTVFLHCVGGNSRTPTVAASYLIASQGMSPESALFEATEPLRSRFHNEGFRRALERVWGSGERDRLAGIWERAQLTC